MNKRGIISIVMFVAIIALNVSYRTMGVSSVAKGNTQRNSFVIGCEKEDTPPEIKAKYDITNYCTCAYDHLKDFYKDKLNDDYWRNILANGYSKQDTELLMQCLIER